jgi:hypothetical protein
MLRIVYKWVRQNGASETMVKNTKIEIKAKVFNIKDSC